MNEVCPQADKHTKRTGTPGPLSNDYSHWNDWCEEMSKTHTQITCEGCGCYEIWLPHAAARAEEQRRRQAATEESARYLRGVADRLAEKRKRRSGV